MSTYWPWWAGAIGLALITIAYTLATDRSFGVSSAWDRVLHWRSERHLERLEEEFTDEQALVDALAAATAEHFGTGPGGPTPQQVPYGETQPRPDVEATGVRAPRSRACVRSRSSPRLPCWCRLSSADASPRSLPGGSSSASTWDRVFGT